MAADSPSARSRREIARPEREVRFGIVGAGLAANVHAAALARIPEARLVAVAGTGSERTARLAAAHGARLDHGLDALLDRGGLDAVILATPHPSHAVAAVAAARAGLHVLVEKPMALTPDECSEMIRAADEAGVVLSVMSQRRWYPAVRRVRTAIEDGRIGEPGLATVEVLGWRGADYYAMDAWRGTLAGEGGGVLINQAVHQLDLLSWFLGPVAEVDGWTANLNHPGIDVEDTAVAIVQFANGALASFVASNSQRPGLHGRVHVHGRNGASVGVETDSGSPFVAGLSPPTIARNDLWTVPGDDDALERWAAEDRDALTGVDIASHYHELQLRDVVEAIRTGRRPAVDGADGRTTVALIAAIYEAARTGQRTSIWPNAVRREVRGWNGQPP